MDDTTSIHIVKDRRGWMAYREGFIDVVSSIVGYGPTPQKAIDWLRENERVRLHKSEKMNGQEEMKMSKATGLRNATTIHVTKDGDAWMAYRDGFIDLHSSIAGFGIMPQDAITALFQAEKREANMKEKTSLVELRELIQQTIKTWEMRKTQDIEFIRRIEVMVNEQKLEAEGDK